MSRKPNTVRCCATMNRLENQRFIWMEIDCESPTQQRKVIGC